MAAVAVAVAAAALGINHIPNRNRNRGGPKPAIRLCFVSWRPTATHIISDWKARVSRPCVSSQLKVIMATETEKLGIKIVKDPPESKLSDLGVRSWPKSSHLIFPFTFFVDFSFYDSSTLRIPTISFTLVSMIDVSPIIDRNRILEESVTKNIFTHKDESIAEYREEWWGCPPSKFPWTYSAKETCYLLKGKVKVFPDGSEEAVEIGAGDLVVFPKGMSCTWDVSEAVDKHYLFE